MGKILGLDVGIGSLGWAVIDEDAESCTIIAFYGDRSDVLNNYRR
jgi:CRISPR/Cas system Type II protein with McrA/HNH and RuvC-like nuclease domain